MLKRFFKHSFLYTFIGFFNKGIGIILTPLYTRVFEPSDYGVLDWLTMLMAIIIGLMSLQIDQGLAFYVADSKEDNVIKRYASNTFSFSMLVYLVPAIVLLADPQWFAQFIIGDSSQWLLIQLFAVAIFLQGNYQFLDNLLKWTLKAKTRFVCSILKTLVTVPLIAYLVLVEDLGLAGIFYGRIAGNIIPIIVAFIYTRKHLALDLSTKYLKPLLAYSTPLILVTLGSLLANYTDRIFIKSMLSFSDMGLYGVGYKFASLINLMFMAIGAALGPLIYNHYKEESTPGEVVKIFRFVFILGSMMILLLSLFSMELLWIFTTPKYYPGFIFVPFVTSMFFFDRLFEFAPGLSLVKKTKKLAAIFLFKLVLNFILNYFFILYWGVLGVAIATLISAVTGLVIQLHYSQKEYYIPYEYKRYVLGFIFVGLAVAAGFNIPLTSPALLVAAKILLIGLVLVVFKWLDILRVSQFLSQLKARLKKS